MDNPLTHSDIYENHIKPKIAALQCKMITTRVKKHYIGGIKNDIYNGYAKNYSIISCEFVYQRNLGLPMELRIHRVMDIDAKSLILITSYMENPQGEHDSACHYCGKMVIYNFCYEGEKKICNSCKAFRDFKSFDTTNLPVFTRQWYDNYIQIICNDDDGEIIKDECYLDTILKPNNERR